MCIAALPPRPTFGLRDYSRCDCALKRYANSKFLTRDGSQRTQSGQVSTKDPRCQKKPDPHCKKCRGTGQIEAVKDQQIGLEKSPEAFVQALVRVLGELRRVLRDDGVVWLNLGDSFAQKQLQMIPARTALALQGEGWYLRSAMPWCKRSPMPESCTDRPATALEWVFQLTKSADYFFDMQAVRRVQKSLGERHEGRSGGREDLPTKRGFKTRQLHPGGRALRSADLWFESIQAPYGLVGVGDELVGLDVTTQSYSGAHFASFPQALVRPLLLASTSQKGCCAECGAPYVRQTKKQRRATRPGVQTKVDKFRDGPESEGRHRTKPNRDPQRHVTDVETTGWEASCTCHAGIAPCVVLDPFAGHCTVGLVAQRHQRAFVGIDLNPEYLQAGAERLRRRGRGDSARRVAAETNWLEELRS